MIFQSARQIESLTKTLAEKDEEISKLKAEVDSIYSALNIRGKAKSEDDEDKDEDMEEDEDEKESKKSKGKKAGDYKDDEDAEEDEDEKESKKGKASAHIAGLKADNAKLAAKVKDLENGLETKIAAQVTSVLASMGIDPINRVKGGVEDGTKQTPASNLTGISRLAAACTVKE